MKEQKEELSKAEEIAKQMNIEVCEGVAKFSRALGRDYPLVTWFGDYAIWEPAVGATNEQVEEAFLELAEELRNAPKSLFTIMEGGDISYYINSSGLDSEGICNAYTACDRPWTQMRKYGERISKEAYEWLKQHGDTFCIEFAPEADRVVLENGGLRMELPLQKLFMPLSEVSIAPEEIIVDVEGMDNRTLCDYLADLYEQMGGDYKLIHVGDRGMWEPADGVTRGQLEEACREMIKHLAVVEAECVAEEAPEMEMSM